MFAEYLDRVRERKPIVHNITNYVTVNDVANAELACGASPIMADDPDEVADIQTFCGGLNLNIGTLNQRKAESMYIAGETARSLGHVIVLDPVGAGASRLRTETAVGLVHRLSPDAIRGNVSEIRALATGSASVKGVDAAAADAVTEENLDEMIVFAKKCAAGFHTILAVTGAIDIVTDGVRCFVIRNGRGEMRKVTGTGCQLSGILTAFLAANPEDRLTAAAAAVAMMGVSGEIGWSRMQEGDGNAAYRNRIIDAICNMDGKTLDARAKAEVRGVSSDQNARAEAEVRGGNSDTNVRANAEARGGNLDPDSLLLYAVTDRRWLHGGRLADAVREALEGGATFVQLREKEGGAMARSELVAEAEEIRDLCRRYEVPFVIDDDVDLALAAGADGVHVGQSDMEAGMVREKIGPDRILGVSAGSVGEAVLAEKRGADYLGVGAVFPTGTKADAEAIDPKELRAICDAVRIPVIAIGGITRDNVTRLSGSGIAGVAVVSAIFAQPDVRAAAADLKRQTIKMLEGQ